MGVDALSKLLKLLFRCVEQGPLGILSVQPRLSGRLPGQDLQSFFNGGYPVHMEFSLLNRLDHLFPKHQVPNILHRYQYPLFSGESPFFTDVKKALDFFVDTADGLDSSPLIYGTGDGQTLLQRNPGEAGKNGIKLRTGSTVPLHLIVALFKGELGGHGQGFFLPKLASQVAGQGQNTLGMDAAAHFSLPLDVENPLVSRIGPGGDSGRNTKSVPPRFQYRKAVDLPNLSSLGFNQDIPLADVLLNLLLDQIQPGPHILDGLFHVTPFHLSSMGLAGQGRCLINQVGQQVKPGSQLFLISRQPGTVFHQTAHSPGGQGQLVFLSAGLAHEMGIFFQILRGPLHGGIKIRLDLEEPPEILIVIIQQHEKVGGSQEDQLQIQGNRFRFQAYGRNQSILLSDILHRGLPVFQGFLQGLPGKGIRQEVVDVEDQVSSVGPMDGPGFDHGKIGAHRQHLALVFDLSEDVVIIWAGFEDDGSPFPRLIADEHVDLEAVEGILFLRIHKGGHLPHPSIGNTENQVVFFHILQNLVQIMDHLGKIFVFVLQSVDLKFGSGGCNALLQLSNGFLGLVFIFLTLSQGFIQLLT